MRFTHATVAGAGLAGLAAAVALRRAGVAVALADGAGQAGGRCRSYRDARLGMVIDNGNHLVLSGNGAVNRFRAAVGADPATLAGPAEAAFPFADVRSGERWTVRINDGRLPWWIAVPGRRVPGSRLADYLPLARLLRRREARVDQVVRAAGPVWERLLDPVLLAVLNTAPAEGSAALAGAVLRETLGRGGRATRPRVAHPGLGAAFVDPALAWLAAHGAAPRLGRRLRALAFAGDRVAGLDWGDGPAAVAPDEAVVLALPAWGAAALVPGLVVPDAHRAILNAHFAHPAPAGAPTLLGLVGGTAEWVFAFPDRVSVTVSAADRLLGRPHDELARVLWDDVRRALGIDAPLPPHRVVAEKRATFAATPAQDRRRPPARTRWRNLFLAGDWTATGLPATIEGALRSGEAAAALVTG